MYPMTKKAKCFYIYVIPIACIFWGRTMVYDKKNNVFFVYTIGRILPIAYGLA